MLTYAFLWCAFLVLLLQDLIKQWIPGSAGIYFPEVLVIAIFAWGLVLQFIHVRSVSRLFFVVLALYTYLVGVSLLFGQQASVFKVFAQSFIHIEYFLLAVGCYGIALVEKKISFHKIFIGLLLITLVGIILNAILGNELFPLLHVHANASALRVGRESGFQLNPNRAGLMLALASVYILFLASMRRSRSVWLYLTVAALAIPIYMTASRSALGIVFLAFIFTMRPSRMPLQIGLVVACLAMVALTQTSELSLIYQKTASNFGQLASNGVTYARWLMIGGGFELAMQHFPIGLGAATYGSTLSSASGAYAQLGLLAYSFISSRATIFDSNIATILGEFGFVGICIFFGTFAYSLRRISRVSSNFGAIEGHRGKIELMFLVIVAFLAVSEPVFMNSYYSMLLILGYFSCWEVKVHEALGDEFNCSTIAENYGKAIRLN